MKLFFAGNFPQMSKLEYEKGTMELSMKKCGAYRRLITFFYEKPAETVLKLKESEHGESEQGRIEEPT